MSGTGLGIREAREENLPAVLVLYAPPDIDDGEVLDLAAARAILHRFAEYPDDRLFIAHGNGRVVGSYALIVTHNLGHLGAPLAVVEDMVVDPAHQGRGVGRHIMQLGEARQRNCYQVALSSNVQRHRAHAFYEGIGFRRHGYSFLVELDGAGQ